jgi:NTE family protein
LDVTFRPLHEVGGTPLKIVATNVTNQCVEVFSYERTPEVAIADAVAASICLPIVFRPWQFSCQRSAGLRADVDTREFLDGGITSNLPVWTLDRERASASDVATVAFSIQPDQPKDRRPGHWAGALASAIIAGSMEIHTRAVGKMVHIPISCSLRIFDFDTKLEKLCEATDKARDAVTDRLKGQLTEFPEILRSGCRQLGQIAVDLLRDEETAWWQNGRDEPPLFKVAFAVQAPREWQFTMPYHHGYERGDGPRIDPELLHDAWETLDPTYILEGRNSDWPSSHYSIVIPISDAGLGGLWGTRKEKEHPLIVVIESDIRVKHDPVSEAEWEGFLGDLADNVVGFVKEHRVYEAVQRSAEAS